MSFRPKQLAELKAKAAISQDGETYHPLLSDHQARAGIVVRRTAEKRIGCLLEASINSEVFRTGVSSRDDKGWRAILEEMQKQGYQLTYEDGRISTFEKSVAPKEMNAEMDKLLIILGDRADKKP